MTDDQSQATGPTGQQSPDSVPSPAALPGDVGTDSTIFAALHGAILLRADWDSEVEPDLYSLFHARSEAMGWLTASVPGVESSEWGMNDASIDTSAKLGRVAWVQADLTRPITPSRPAPVQQFLACIRDSVAQVGALELDTLHILVPIQKDPSTSDSSTSSRFAVAGTLLSQMSWFTRSPERRAPIRFTLDSGGQADAHHVAKDVFDWCEEIQQDMVTFDAMFLSTADALPAEPAIDEGLWPEPGRHQANFDGELSEWSSDAIGWLSTFMIDAALQHGLRCPVVVSVSRR